MSADHDLTAAERTAKAEARVADQLPPHPRIWWDGRDFLYLLPGSLLGPPGDDGQRRDRRPGFYRAQKIEDVVMSDGSVVELSAARSAPGAPSSAEIDAAARALFFAMGWPHADATKSEQRWQRLCADADAVGEPRPCYEAAVSVLRAALAVRSPQSTPGPTATELRANTHQERADHLAIGLMRLRDEVSRLIREDREVENANRCGESVEFDNGKGFTCALLAGHDGDHSADSRPGYLGDAS